MHLATKWSRALVIAGLTAMILGIVDPLEGSVIIALGSAMVALGVAGSRSQHRKINYWSFGLIATGVAAMWIMSAFGGIGGSSGHSWWWGLTLLPYPTGWLLGLAGAVRELRSRSHPTALPV